ncbi:hypothetical protein [Methyloceanibacter sp.]
MIIDASFAAAASRACGDVHPDKPARIAYMGRSLEPRRQSRVA